MQVTDDQQSALIDFGSFCNKREFSDVNFTFMSKTNTTVDRYNNAAKGWHCNLCS